MAAVHNCGGQITLDLHRLMNSQSPIVQPVDMHSLIIAVISLANKCFALNPTGQAGTEFKIQKVKVKIRSLGQKYLDSSTHDKKNILPFSHTILCFNKRPSRSNHMEVAAEISEVFRGRCTWWTRAPMDLTKELIMNAARPIIMMIKTIRMAVFTAELSNLKGKM